MADKTSEYQMGRRNLITAVIFSIPGPVVLALSLGGSMTQLADFLRRSCELLSVMLALWVFEISHRSEACRQRNMEAAVRIATSASMVFSGAVISWLAVSRFGSQRGSVITSLVLAILGAAVNGRLYLGCRKLHHGVLNIQAKLYCVKMFLDIWMAGVLLICTFASDPVRGYADLIGSVSIAVYVIVNGIRILRSKETEQ